MLGVKDISYVLGIREQHGCSTQVSHIKQTIKIILTWRPNSIRKQLGCFHILN
jgi:hypothetical protein